jgi:hypothetical protein
MPRASPFKVSNCSTNNNLYGPQSREHPFVATVSNRGPILQISRLRSPITPIVN